jgi:hypothetical protein
MSQPRSIRFDDDVYLALSFSLAEKKKAGEKIDFTQLVNEIIRSAMPISLWNDLAKRVENLESEIKTIKENT